MFPKHQSNYTFYQNSGALLIAIFGALSVADYSNINYPRQRLKTLTAVEKDCCIILEKLQLTADGAESRLRDSSTPQSKLQIVVL